MIVTVGTPDRLGATPDGDGVNFAVWSAHATAVAVSLFDAADKEVARVRLPGRTGAVFHGHLSGIGVGARYGVRAYGPWNPARGHRFDPAKLLVDPYAAAIDRSFRLHADLFNRGATDTAPLVPKSIVTQCEPDDTGDRTFPWDRAVIYELHVRGFTMRHPDIPAAQRGTFAGLGHPAAIAHLQRLGVTVVELMPCAAWCDERHLPALGRSNYWGYNPVAMLAPDPRLAPGGWPEIRAAVGALQAAGIAVILDVVLNHSGESDQFGPTLSLRGLDNASYYRLEADDPSLYVNDAGCGNVLALDRPAGVHLAMAALRGWALRAGLDGFRLDLATTLARRDTGFDPDAPLFAAMAQDPVLARRAIIAEPWDIGADGHQLGAFPAAWGEWNDRSRDTYRRFWRGDGGMLAGLATRLAGSADVFAPRHRPLSRSINYVTAHDGFTLADLVSYATKHNLANGEHNRDGSSDNLSWNNGVEGDTDDPEIRAMRRRDARALLATLLLSRGTPMLSMGDEAGRSQAGNNNAYAQDNATAWFDWTAADQELIDYTARLIRARLDHAMLHAAAPLTGEAGDEGFPDVAWRLADGRTPDGPDWHSDAAQTLVMVLRDGDHRVAIVLHAGAAAVEIVLPPARNLHAWRCEIDSATDNRSGRVAETITAAPRSVLLLIEAPDVMHRRSGADSAALDALARAAGIAPVWWDIAGGEHRVGDDTKRVLLASMRLPAETASDVADGLARLAARQSAPLPTALVLRDGQPVIVPLGQRARAAWLTVLREDGGTDRVAIPPDAPEVELPPLPLGRHRLLLDDRLDAACAVTIAPQRCYLPPALVDGQRAFGVAAHLYSLRRDGDGGIGDFTTLRQLAREAAGTGASVIGLNPLHALFPTDRSRASPYHPSDRRFLDPIYIDTGTARPAAGAVVDYAAVWAAKLPALRAQFVDDDVLRAFIAAGGTALHRFAVFQAIADTIGHTDWPRWPAELRHPTAPGIAAFAAAHARAIRFIGFQQMLAERQLAAAVAGADLAIGFYRDLAVGAAPDGAEAWSRQDILLTGASIGAPPDPFAADGQVWCLPAPDPLAMAREGYAGFAELLRANMRHAGALRIDHVMGLQRLFLVPDGASAKHGAYVGYPFHDLLGQVALESQRARCLVVGEALGTVPEGMPQALAAADVLSYAVLWFEQSHGRYRAPRDWPRDAAACVSTHDLPTLTGWWQGADIAERRALGQGTMSEAERASDKAALIALLVDEGLLAEAVDLHAPLPDAVAVAVHALVARTPALLTLVQADDLAGEATAVNLPGTDRERPNWRRRLAVPVQEMLVSGLARQIIEAMAKARNSPSR